MRWHSKSWPALFVSLTAPVIPSPALIVPLPVLITPFPAHIFPSKLTPNVSNNIPRNLSFCSFTSFLIVSLTPIISKRDSSRDLAIVQVFIWKS